MNLLTLRVPPLRMLKLQDAAHYCGVPVKRFPADCGISPVQMPHGQKLYDIKDLDRWLDSLKTNAPNTREGILGRLAG